MENQEQAFKRLHAIFEENGDGIRKQFILAGLLLTIFERFKIYVIGQVDEFFSHHMEIMDGQIMDGKIKRVAPLPSLRS